MTSLQETLVQLRTDLEGTIDRECATLLRKPRRRWYIGATVAGLLVVLGASSALGSVQEHSAKPFARGKVTRTVDGVRFSLLVSKPGWTNGPVETIGDKFRTHSLLISKSTVGGQSAEAVIFWTSFPAGGQAAPCTAVLSPAIGRSTGALARAMGRAPGTKLVEGPTRVTVGGRPAMHVVLTVTRDLGCDPGFFFSWRPSAPDGECWAACWLKTYVGDTISVWVVDVAGKRLVIEAETRQPKSRKPLAIPVTRADVLKVEAEIETIIESIRFR